jgi:hypothetical protein
MCIESKMGDCGICFGENLDAGNEYFSGYLNGTAAGLEPYRINIRITVIIMITWGGPEE